MLIKTPSRIHITLIDLNAKIGRVDGGIGIALEEPCFKIKFEESESFSVIADKELEERIKKIKNDFFDYFSKKKKINDNLKIEVIESYPQHIGLGSGTQLALAVAKAFAELNNIKASVRELAIATKRGGTSGIGVAAFEKGGFILDAGHSKKEKPEFLPSSASKAKPAKVIARYDFPWDLLIVIPKGKRIYEKREVNIFKEYCPIKLREVRKLCHVILMKTIPSLLERDMQAFGESINEIQKIGFKKIEVSLQSKEVKKILKLCQRYSAGAGLSSFGPSIYCIGFDEEKIRDKVENAKIIRVKPNNKGAFIEK